MSRQRNLVCRLLVKDSFGPYAENVGKVLLEKGTCSLRYILAECQEDPEQIKKILCVFIQQNILTFEYNKKGFVEYTLDTAAILCRIRFMKYIYSAKTLYGDAAELLIEELLQKGQLLMSEVVTLVTCKLNEALKALGQPTIGENFVEDKFSSLAKTHFLKRCPTPVCKDEKVISMEFTEKEEDLFKLPTDTRKRKKSVSEDEPSSKRLKSDRKGSTSEVPGDKGIFWQVNVHRFHQLLRDQVIVSAITKKVDQKAGEILRTILRVSETRTDPSSPTTNAVSVTEIHNALPKELGVNRKLLETYLSILVEDSTQFVMRVGDSGGGMFSVNIYESLLQLTTAHIESVVQERFGSKCLRIFRLLILKKHLEQKQIEDLAMISAKEAKELLYIMFSQNFISLTEISKTPDHAPSRTFYLFNVDIDQVARMVLERSYKALYNAMLRREAELQENRRVLEKQERVDAIIASLIPGDDTTQREEIEQTITPHEKEQINKVKHTVQMLDQSEIQIDEAIFVLETYLYYAKQNLIRRK